MDGAAILNEWKDGDEHLALSKEDRIVVREFLNFFEFLAVGLKHDIYDEKMVMDAMKAAIVRYHKKGKNLGLIYLLPHGKRRFDGVIGAAKIPVFGGIPGED